MGLFSIFKKKEKKQDLNKEYLSIDDKSFDAAYAAFKDFDHISAVLGRRHL